MVSGETAIWGKMSSFQWKMTYACTLPWSCWFNEDARQTVMENCRLFHVLVTFAYDIISGT